MALQLSPWILLYLVSASITGGLALYAWRHRHGREGVRAFALLNFSAMLYALDDGLMWASPDITWQYFWLRLFRPGVDFGPLFWLLFVLQYTGKGAWITRRRLFLLCVVPAIGGLLGWTNAWHHLIWSGMRQAEWNGLMGLVPERGPLWQPLLFYQQSAMLAGAALVVAAVMRSWEKYREQAFPLLTAVSSPLAAGILFTLRPSPLDPNSLALAVSGLALSWSIFRHGLLDLVPAARHTIIEGMGDAMIVLDESDRFVDLNPAAKRILGLSQRSVIGVPIDEVVAEWTAFVEVDRSRSAVRASEIVLGDRSYELRISTLGGDDGAVAGRMLLLHDVTEQMQAREALRQTEETAEVILESIEDGYYEIDLRGTFTKITDATATVIGLPRAQVPGTNFAQLMDEATAKRLLDLYGEVYRTGTALTQLDYDITTLDGSTKHLEASASLIRDAAGNPIGFRGIVRDTTERRRAEQELQQAKHAAEEASRAKGAFLATVSHELRTPLTSVLGFAKLIKRRLADTIRPAASEADPKVQRALQQIADNIGIIVSEGERLTVLIDEVLDLAKIESGKLDWHMQAAIVAEIVQRATAATSSLSEAKGLNVRTEIEEMLPAVIGDPDRLIQVVINLLSNAIKFTDQGGIVCRARRIDRSVEVSVTDTGAGISDDDQPKVFERFVQVGDTLTNKPKGTGLGLPICKQIVEHHGGRIWVESKLGCGSTFAFTLPIEPAAPPAE
jgi:PAS domain S-box-containing protein